MKVVWLKLFLVVAIAMTGCFGCLGEAEEDPCDETFVGGCDGNVATYCFRSCGFGPCSYSISEDTCEGACVESGPEGNHVGTTIGVCEAVGDMGMGGDVGGSSDAGSD